MKKIVSRGACLLLASCLSLNAVGCQKSNENNKIKEGQSISSEEAGMSINANGKISASGKSRRKAGTRIRFFIDKPAAMISFPRAVIKYL